MPTSNILQTPQPLKAVFSTKTTPKNYTQHYTQSTNFDNCCPKNGQQNGIKKRPYLAVTPNLLKAI